MCATSFKCLSMMYNITVSITLHHNTEHRAIVRFMMDDKFSTLVTVKFLLYVLSSI